MSTHYLPVLPPPPRSRRSSVETARLVLRVGLAACVALVCLVALSLALSSCRAPDPPAPVPPEELRVAPAPSPSPGGASYLAQNPATVAVGTACPEYADPSTCAIAVAVENTAPIPIVAPDGGVVVQGPGTPGTPVGGVLSVQGVLNGYSVDVTGPGGVQLAEENTQVANNALLTQIAPATTLSAVTPSDVTTISCTSLYVGGTGNVVVDGLASGTSITFAAVPTGTSLPIQVTKVHAATTATSIVCLR